MTDTIGYGALIEDAMLNVVKGALRHLDEKGLGGEHHFYITFMTTADGVSIPSSLLDKHPQAMTIVLENQFWNLKVTDEAFSVDLSFNKMQQTLYIPFSSILSFDDPSVQFSLHFNSSVTSEDGDDLSLVEAEDDSDVEYNQDNVLSFADFKKKKYPKDSNED